MSSGIGSGGNRRSILCLSIASAGGRQSERLPEVERGEAAVRAPALADLDRLRRRSASPPARTRSGSPCGCPRSPPERTSGRSRWKIRNISAVHWPRPRTATISSITSSSPSSSSRSSSSSPLDHVGGEVADVLDLAAGEPGAAQVLLVDLEQLLGGRGVAAEEVEHAQVDRPRRFGRELLADDRPQQRPVGVGGPLFAAPRSRVGEVDLADPLDQRRHHRVGGGERGRASPRSRSPSLPLAACASRRRRGCPRGSPRRRSRTRAARSGPPPAASVSSGVE